MKRPIWPGGLQRTVFGDIIRSAGTDTGRYGKSSRWLFVSGNISFAGEVEPYVS
ncbi:MAG: hypothetical protein IJ971_08310 [Bacteroidales bacterium]|nr:hypothetical protein [Bacteroidales bacterium]